MLKILSKIQTPMSDASTGKLVEYLVVVGGGSGASGGGGAGGLQQTIEY